jgi:GNAT superfamily N-acetyltransferase
VLQGTQDLQDELTFKPAGIAQWADLEALFSSLPAPGMCWCMYWRKTRAEWWGQAAENEAALHALLEAGETPGILAYDRQGVVGWCSLAPRATFPGLDRSPTLRSVDEAPVWSITCFVIAKRLRRMGLTRLLIREAVRFAASRGAGVIEAYPLQNLGGKDRLVSESFMGFASTFESLGFVQVSHRSGVPNIYRLYLPADEKN